MSRPIFFDPTGTRKRRSRFGVFALLALLVVTSIVFATTILDVQPGSPLPIRFERAQPAPLAANIADFKHGVDRRLRNLGWLPRRSLAGMSGKPLTVGFYVPWDDASRESLANHIAELDWVVPSTLEMNGADHAIKKIADPRFDAVMASAAKRPALFPMLQNALDGTWDGAGAAAMVRNPAARTKVIADLSAELEREHAAGVVFDFEDMPADAVPYYRLFIAQARAALARSHRIVTLTVPAGDESWNLAAFAKVADRIFLMNYDEHWQGGTAGPIASQPWFVQQLRDAITKIGRDKLIVAFGSYAYDWHGGKVDALGMEEAWLAAHDSGAKIAFDAASGNAYFDYEEDGEVHHIWMLDAASVWNQLMAVRAGGIGAVAMWRLGSEDPGVWSVLSTWRNGKLPDLSSIRSVTNVDIEGNGEILRIDAAPQAGTRTLTADKRGLIRAETYDALPTPYAVQRVGSANPKLLALTFDDGPDPTWTPRILDILAEKHAPGAFFIVGENGLAHPLLLRRIVAQGSEIGNHSYTHPNMAQVSARGIGLELNTTQRLIQAYTGRSTRLFRAPYFGDAEPTTADELDPALIAQEHGYTVVGLHVDPGDWKRPGVDTIIRETVNQVLSADSDRSENVILLHDGGGDRSQTVAALPQIIDILRAKGYSFVPVSQLAGMRPSQVMPLVTGGDLVAVRADIGIFAALAALSWALEWLFFLAISLGIGRAVLMASLAWWSSRTDRRRIVPPLIPDTLVSVIIPAWNEERVIVSSIARVLASTDAAIEVIVADDGSTDQTSAVVREAYAGNPRVRLLTLTNGGKASALNRALLVAKGEIVVALDADTQFETDTVARLVRWFADPEVGAVAGNAKVGNRVNLVTRWQAVEYVTAQNVERRALARFDAMTVVPGAVGAWRRAALDSVGGYPEDTLAEDQDLTIAIQRAGWTVEYDVDAVAWTEAPESFRALAKQRFRWAFGTLQCLWKHRAILRKREPAGLALVGIPQAWLFQIVFAAISPLIDLALLISIVGTWTRVQQHGWAQTQSDVVKMAIYWIVFTAIDIICGWVAYRLEPREKHYPAHLLVAQRFIYRQLMYWVVLKAIASAIGGFWIGWGKLERSGRVTAR